MKKMSNLKWLLYWIGAAGLLAFGILLVLLEDFRNSVVIFISALLLLLWVIIRVIPLLKYTKNKSSVILNVFELTIDTVIAILIFVNVVKQEKIDFLSNAYPYLLGGVVYLRGLVYLIEVTFLGTKPTVTKFIVHILLITLGTIIAFGGLSINIIGYIFAVAFMIVGLFFVYLGYSNFRDYKADKPKKEKKVKKEKEVKVEDTTNTTVVPENNESETTYVA